MKKIKLNDIVKVNQSGEWGAGLKEGEIGTKVIRTADFNNDGSINYDNVIFRNIQQKKIDEKKLIYGDIIIEKSGGTDKNPVGRVVFFNDDNNIYLSNNFTQVIRIKESMNSKFVFYNLYFNYKNGSTLQMFNKTTGIQNLQMKQFLNQKISYISLEEQEIAVRKLDNVRNIIEIKQKQLQDLDELIKSQFVEMFENRNFQQNKIKEFAIVKAGGTPDRKNKLYWENGTIPWIKTGEVKENVIVESEEYITKLGLENSSANLFEVGTILIAMYGQGVTRGKCAKLGIRATTNQACVGINIINDKILNDFLFYYLQLKYEEIRNLGLGGVQPNLNSNMIKEFEVTIPPIELQKEFIELVKQIDKQKFEIQKSLEEMQNLQESLMNKYFGG